MSELLAGLRDIEFAYGSAGGERVTALRGISFDLHSGDRIGLLGPSGAGKSTLLHVLAGLLRPQQGRVERPAGEGAPASLVFQFPERQLFAETVAEDVQYGLRQSGVPQDEVESRVAKALEDVGLPPQSFSSRAPFHLSGGEMRRVALAGALAQRRRLLLLDEPTLGLDAEGLGRLSAALERAHAADVAILMATHDADFVAATCDRVLVLEAGAIAFDGAPRVLWADPERAARLGVDLPRAWELVARLRARGVEPAVIPESEAEFVATFERLIA